MRSALFFWLAALVVFLGCLVPVPVLAAQPAPAVLYAANGAQQFTPSPYRVARVLTGASLGVGAFNQPQGIAYSATTGTLYIADTNNNRVVAVSSSGRATVFGTSGAGQLQRPTGVAFDKGLVLVADPSEGRIVVFLPSGAYVGQMTVTSTLFKAQHLTFAPEQIAVSPLGTILVINRNTYQGLLAFTQAGQWTGFFGASAPRINPLYEIERSLMTAAQRAQLLPLYPSAPGGVAVGGAFAYVTNPYRLTGQIRRISVAGGGNTFPKSVSASEGPTVVQGFQVTAPRFRAIAVSPNGFIYTVDTTSSQIFVYDSGGTQLFAIGGTGNRLGAFARPVSLAAVPGGGLYVLDMRNGDVQLLEPTLFGRQVRAGAQLYQVGHYRQAAADWQAVLRSDAAYPLALMGIAQADMEEGNTHAYSLGDAAQGLPYWDAAMRDFRLAGDASGYQQAHADVQLAHSRQGFAWLVVGFLALLALAIVVARWGRDAWTWAYRRWVSRWAPEPLEEAGRMLSFLVHPSEEIFLIKWVRPVSRVTVVLLMAWLVVSRVISRLVTGYAFLPASGHQVHPLALALETFTPLALWTGSTYGVADMLGGEGRLGEVWSTTLLCALPYAILAIPVALISRLLVPGDAGVYGFFHLLEIVWIATLLVSQITALHDFNGAQVVRALVFSLLGALGLVFAAILVLGLTGQLGHFIDLISHELVILGVYGR